MLSAWELLAAEVPDGWSWRARDVIGLVTGLATPAMNGVWATSAGVNVDAVRAALDTIIDAEVPYCLQFPGSHRGLAALAVELGMEREADVPLMWLCGEPVARDIPGLSVRRVSAGELMTHVDLAARGFGAPVEIFRSLATLTARTPGLGTYVGEYDGEPVTTAVALCVDDSVGVFTVATPGEHRGHGFGTAITAYAIRDGYRLGAERAWLQSSLEGYSVYEAMGFATVASWQCWTAYPTLSVE